MSDSIIIDTKHVWLSLIIWDRCNSLILIWLSQIWRFTTTKTTTNLILLLLNTSTAAPLPALPPPLPINNLLFSN